jgi:hypothetical protein
VKQAMPDRIDELIIGARPIAPPHYGVLAAVGARGVPEGVGAAAWMLRAAALLALAAGVGALAVLLPGHGVGSPAAGDVSLAQAQRRLQDRSSQLPAHSPGESALRQALADFSARVDVLEARSPAALDRHVEQLLDKSRAEQLRTRQEAHIRHAARRYDERMQDRLAELEQQGLNDHQLAQARIVLEGHRDQALGLIRAVYANGRRWSGSEFATLARETEDRLSRITGENEWKDLLGTDSESWGPTSDVRDWADFDSLMEWNRRTTSG